MNLAFKILGIILSFLIVLKYRFILENFFTLYTDLCIILLPITIVAAITISFIYFCNKNKILNKIINVLFVLIFIGFTGICLDNIRTFFYINKNIFYAKIVFELFLLLTFIYPTFKNKTSHNIQLLTLITLFVISYVLKLMGII